MLRAISRSVVGRWLLFAAWLWLGWHLFMRGWSFFLAGPGARTPPRSSKTAGQLFTQVVVPLLVAYRGWLAVLAAGRRGRLRGATRSTSPGALVPARRRAWHLGISVTGGDVTFVALIGMYAAVSGRAGGGVFREAVRDGALLAFAAALPVFLVVGVAQAEWRARRARTGRGPP